MIVTGAMVLEMLLPNGGWVIYGDDYNSIIWSEGAEQITEAQFDEGFNTYPSWKAEQDAEAAAQKAAAEAKLEALGLTSEDLKALGL